MATTKLQDLQYVAIEAVNALVEVDASFEDRNRSIEIVRKHLEARAEQTAGSLALEDLIGDWR